MNPNLLRKFENFTSFLDDIGIPLVGRVRFQAGTGETHIYDEDGTELGTSIFTDAFGRTSKQVFLEKTKSFEVYFDKYVGEGDMATDVETDSWKNIGYCFEPNTEEENTSASPDISSVSNIATLTALRPTADGTIVNLLGYTTAGDKPVVQYKWNASSTSSNNGGTIIAQAGQIGAWIMSVKDGVIDIRDFGVFPNTANQSARINQALTWINSNAGSGARIYFPRGQYDISGCSLKNCITEKHTSFYVLTGSNASIESSDNNWSINTSVDGTKDGTLTIRNETVYTSCINSSHISLQPKNALVLDSVFAYSSTITGVDVYVTCAQTNLLKFDHCNFIYDGQAKFSRAMQFDDCKVPVGLFESDANFTDSTFTDCEFLWDDNNHSAIIENFKTIARTYSPTATATGDFYCKSIEATGDIHSNALLITSGQGLKTDLIFSSQANVNIGTAAANNNLNVNGNVIAKSVTANNGITVGSSGSNTSSSIYGSTYIAKMHSPSAMFGTLTSEEFNTPFLCNGNAHFKGGHCKIDKLGLEFVSLASIYSNLTYCELDVRSYKDAGDGTARFSFPKYMLAQGCVPGDIMVFKAGADIFNGNIPLIIEKDTQEHQYDNLTNNYYTIVKTISPYGPKYVDGSYLPNGTSILNTAEPIINEIALVVMYCSQTCVTVLNPANLDLHYRKKYIWRTTP